MDTPKDKANYLVKKFTEKNLAIFNSGSSEQGRVCALFHVSEILSLFASNRYDSKYIYYEAVQRELFNK